MSRQCSWTGNVSKPGNVFIQNRRVESIAYKKPSPTSPVRHSHQLYEDGCIGSVLLWQGKVLVFVSLSLSLFYFGLWVFVFFFFFFCLFFETPATVYLSRHVKVEHLCSQFANTHCCFVYSLMLRNMSASSSVNSSFGFYYVTSLSSLANSQRNAASLALCSGWFFSGIFCITKLPQSGLAYLSIWSRDVCLLILQGKRTRGNSYLQEIVHPFITFYLFICFLLGNSV